MTTKDSRKIVVESAEAVLGLHWFVARDFTVKDKGIEIEIVTPGIRTRFDWSDPRSQDHHLVTPTNYQKAFEEGRADIYRALWIQGAGIVVGSGVIMTAAVAGSGLVAWIVRTAPPS